MNGPILIALDGSPFSERALPWALELSRRAGVGLDIVTIAEPVPTLEYAEWNMQAEAWATDYVRRVASDSTDAAGGPVTTHSATGQPLNGIVKRIREIDASVAVAATHGRGPLARAWLGSVADGLLREAGVPVLLLRPAGEGESTPEPTISKIVVSLDGSRVAAAALADARRLAGLFEAELHLVRIVTYPSEIASPYLPQTVALNQSVLEKAHAEASAHLERTAEELRAAGLTVEGHVTDDLQSAAGITRIAREVGADLIVMATHGRGGISRALLGSTTDKVVRTAARPVWVVPVGDSENG